MPSFNLSDFLNATLAVWSVYPLIFLVGVASALIVAWKFAMAAWVDDAQPEQPNLLPYEPRSFQKPAAKGFTRGSVVSMQARKRDGDAA